MSLIKKRTRKIRRTELRAKTLEGFRVTTTPHALLLPDASMQHRPNIILVAVAWLSCRLWCNEMPVLLFVSPWSQALCFLIWPGMRLLRRLSLPPGLSYHLCSMTTCSSSSRPWCIHTTRAMRKRSWALLFFHFFFSRPASFFFWNARLLNSNSPKWVIICFFLHY